MFAARLAIGCSRCRITNSLLGPELHLYRDGRNRGGGWGRKDRGCAGERSGLVSFTCTCVKRVPCSPDSSSLHKMSLAVDTVDVEHATGGTCCSVVTQRWNNSICRRTTPLHDHPTCHPLSVWPVLNIRANMICSRFAVPSVNIHDRTGHDHIEYLFPKSVDVVAIVLLVYEGYSRRVIVPYVNDTISTFYKTKQYTVYMPP